jgi:predicted RNase H-like HicB family nuclease
VHLAAVFMQVPEGCIGLVEELPGANTQGNTLEEARENLREAVGLVLETNRELAERSLAGQPVIREPFQPAPCVDGTSTAGDQRLPGPQDLPRSGDPGALTGCPAPTTRAGRPGPLVGPGLPGASIAPSAAAHCPRVIATDSGALIGLPCQ